VCGQHFHLENGFISEEKIQLTVAQIVIAAGLITLVGLVARKNSFFSLSKIAHAKKPLKIC